MDRGGIHCMEGMQMDTATMENRTGPYKTKSII